MNKRATLIAFLVAAVGALSPQVASAQAMPDAGSPRVEFRLLHSFLRGPGGIYPQGGLVQASDGNFYGVTSDSGYHGKGTVFRLRPGGAVITVHSFSGPDGTTPVGGLIQARDGNLYGSTQYRGPFGGGTLFRMTPDGQLTTLFAFHRDGPEGRRPTAALVEASDGNLYGTARGGPKFAGTVFRMSLDGSVTLVHAFDPKLGEPAAPGQPLIQARDGHLYGTSSAGGTEGRGTVFRVTLDGTLTVLKSFSSTGPDGSDPLAGLLEGMDGRLYGTTSRVGLSFFSGTAFAITTEGSSAVLHTFRRRGKAGYYPTGTLVQGPDGNLYGGTNAGGAFGDGTVFRMTLDGQVADLHAFDNRDNRDGSGYKTLVRSADGRLYGTAGEGGGDGFGTLFAMGEKPVSATAPSTRPCPCGAIAALSGPVPHYIPHRNAAVCTGLSHSPSILASAAHTVIEQPAISSDVTYEPVR